MTEGPSLSQLPKSLQDIAERCGMETATALVEHFGGTRIWVPKNWRPDHILNVLGEERAQALCSFICGDELTVPKNLWTSEALHDGIKSLDAEGISQREIARRLGCTERTVRRELWRKGPRPIRSRTMRFIDHRQIDLEEWISNGTTDKT